VEAVWEEEEMGAVAMVEAWRLQAEAEVVV
jgi:hypothetical protein